MLPSAYLCLNSGFCQGACLLWGSHTAARGHIHLFWDEGRKPGKTLQKVEILGQQMAGHKAQNLKEAKSESLERYFVV